MSLRRDALLDSQFAVSFMIDLSLTHSCAAPAQVLYLLRLRHFVRMATYDIADIP
jgi:hypothetical protein